MKCINERRVIAYLGRDPVKRDLGNGRHVVNFSAATSQRYKNKAGEVKEHTEWHHVTVFNQGLADLCMERLHAGSRVYVEGQHRTREYVNKDGVRNREGEIVVSPFNGDILFLDTGADEELAAMARNGFPSNPADYEIEPAAGEAGSDDEIPF